MAQLPDWMSDHIQLYLTDPDKAHYWDSSLGGSSGMVTTLLLITRGRKSGEERMLPLIYQRVGDAFVIIASKGGAPSHPAWYLNLQENPECEVRAGAAHFRVKARTTEGAERDELWDRLAAVYPPYNDYQVSAGERQIPVVALDIVESL
jgi:deazaflavin-dependent oxidoreductase (nitroreductase family)